MEKQLNYSTRGYLKGDFEFFHLKDQKDMRFEFHHHDFNKIVIFLSGNASYLIEGTTYKLKPWDILLVNGSDLHKALVDSTSVYERIVIWLDPSFLARHSNEHCDLLDCFNRARIEKNSLVRLTPEFVSTFRFILNHLEEACRSSGFGTHILKNSLFLQLIVYLNRLHSNAESNSALGDVEFDRNISAMLNYINDNLTDDLSVDSLAARFYMNRHYLMHRFKLQTGYSIHNYIVKKRLILAKKLLATERQMKDICVECGFGDYSSFVRAFTALYGCSPRSLKKSFGTQSVTLGDNHMVNFQE